MNHGSLNLSMRRQLGFTKTAHSVLQEALIEIVSAAAAEASGSSQGGVFIGEFVYPVICKCTVHAVLPILRESLPCHSGYLSLIDQLCKLTHNQTCFA